MIDNLFSVPVYKAPFDTSKIDLDYELDRKWQSKTLTSYNNKNNLSPKSKEYLIENLHLYTNSIIEKSHKIDLIEIWINKYSYKDYQETHLHPFSDFSFTIFVKVPENSSDFVFYHPAIDNFYRYDKLGNNFFGTIKPVVNENLILVWPSYLKHMVTQHNNKKKERITISGNFNVKL